MSCMICDTTGRCPHSVSYSESQRESALSQAQEEVKVKKARRGLPAVTVAVRYRTSPGLPEYHLQVPLELTHPGREEELADFLWAYETTRQGNELRRSSSARRSGGGFYS